MIACKPHSPISARTATRRFRLLALALTGWLLANFAGPAALAVHAQERDRLWVLWERVDPRPCAENGGCVPERDFTVRLLDTPPRAALERTIGMLDRLALERGQPPILPDAPRICQHNDPELRLGFQPENWPLSPKPEALAGLEGVHISVLSLKAPPGWIGDFGGDLQLEIERRFRAAGIRLLSEEERQVTPGKPKLNVYFSNTNPVTGCHYSVFASLTQTVLLTRNITTKLEVGTWGMSGGPSDEFPDANEADAILRVIDRFIADFLLANPELSARLKLGGG